jgi:N-acetylated-alpha-linked acidic dipeptidase
MLADKSFQLAADPTETSGVPDALLSVPAIDFTVLESAVKRLESSARAYDKTLAQNGAKLDPASRESLNKLMLTLDQTLAPPVGLPGRTWYKNLIYAPGRYTGYGAKTLPAVTEAIEEQRWDDAVAYMKYTADALNAYSARLEEATQLLGRH